MKKEIKNAIDTLISGEAKFTNKGRPRTNFKEITKTSQEGTKENEIRATFIVNEDILAKLKAVAYWDRLTIKEVIHDALTEYISTYESKRNKIKPIPAKK